MSEAKRIYQEEPYKKLKECCLRGKEGIKEWNKRRESELEIHLESSDLTFKYLVDADLSFVHFEEAKLTGAFLQEANLSSAHIEGANFEGANLQGANFQQAVADGATSLWGCKIRRYSRRKRYTDFRGVALGNMRIEPGVRRILEYNARRKNWEDWYKQGGWESRLLKNVSIRPFWWVSDYGYRTRRIVAVFFGLALLFAAIYYCCGIMNPPGVVSNLFEVEMNTGIRGILRADETGEGGIVFDLRNDEPRKVRRWIRPCRAIYFSIVTMTTLGFGDMYADPDGFLGHILLSVQVILGYILLGALVTRFAIMFTTGGPINPDRLKEEEEPIKKEKKIIMHTYQTD